MSKNKDKKRNPAKIGKRKHLLEEEENRRWEEYKKGMDNTSYVTDWEYEDES